MASTITDLVCVINEKFTLLFTTQQQRKNHRYVLKPVFSWGRMDSNGNNFPFSFLATAFFRSQPSFSSLQLLSFCVKAIIRAIILFSHYKRLRRQIHTETMQGDSTYFKYQYSKISLQSGKWFQTFSVLSETALKESFWIFT